VTIHPADTLHVFQCDEADLAVPDTAPGTPVIHQLTSRGDTSELDLQMHELYRIVLDRVNPRHADLIRIAAYVYRVDMTVSRGGDRDSDAAKWKRRLHLCIPVSEPDLWNQPAVLGALQAALVFLTDDQWTFTFSPAADHPATVQCRLEAVDPYAKPGVIVLFSGGLDSLCTLVDAAINGERPVPLGHWASHRIRSRQERLIRQWNAQYPALTVPLMGASIMRRGATEADSSQRARGFLYGCLASAVAAETGAPRVYLADNGPISLNLPINDQLVGAMASRATHPRYFLRLNALLHLVLRAPVTVSNPLQWKTRVEALDILKSAHVEHLVEATQSCSSASRLPGSTPHCGGCSQCIDRRMATTAAGLTAVDPPARYHQDLFLDVLDPWHRAMTAYSYVRFARMWVTLADQEALARFPQFLDLVTENDPDPEHTIWEALDLMRRHTASVMQVVTGQLKAHVDDLVAGTLPAGSLLGKVAGEQHGRRAPQTTLQLVPATPVPLEHRASAVPDPSDPRSILQWTGKGWSVHFGSRTTTLPASVNLTRLAVLLREPQRAYSAEEIEAIVNGSIDHPGAQGRRENDLSVTASRQSVFDRKTIRQARAEIRRHNDRAAALRAQGDVDLAEEVEADAAVIARFLEQGLGLGGQSRTIANPDQRRYRMVRRSLERALDLVADVHPPLATHLRQTIHLDSPFTYTPEPLVSWTVILPHQAA
jgi:7-cyano-7-deazaguanine synthase in queuosine biosynthesis